MTPNFILDLVTAILRRVLIVFATLLAAHHFIPGADVPKVGALAEELAAAFLTWLSLYWSHLDKTVLRTNDKKVRDLMQALFDHAISVLTPKDNPQAVTPPVVPKPVTQVIEQPTNPKS